MTCTQCADFCRELQVRTPGELERIVRVVKAALDSGVLLDVSSGDFATPMTELLESGWPDFVNADFRCNACGQAFQLRCETYHGSGGRWTYASNQKSENGRPLGQGKAGLSALKRSNSLSLFQKALKMARKFEISNPHLDVLKSIILQLEYLVAVELGTEKNRSRLKEIVVGVQAAREIDSIDLTFADVLYQVSEAVERMRADDV